MLFVVDKRSIILVVAFGSSFVLAMLVAAMFSGQGSDKGGLTSSKKKLRAKAGTARENARALVSSRPSDSSESSREPKGGEREIWGHLGKTRKELAASLGERLAQEAMNAASSEEGIERIRAQLAAGGTFEGSSALHSALGRLEARILPVNVAAVAQAFDTAIEAAQTPEEHVNAVYYQAQTFLQLGEVERALAATKNLPEERGKATGRALEVQILAGIAQQEAGNDEAAIKAYAQTLKAVANLDEEPTPEVANIYRQAALRLSRLYRDQGDTAKAARVARDMQFLLND